MIERDWPAFGLNYLHPAWSTSIPCTCGIAGEKTKYSLTFVPHALYTSLSLRENWKSTAFNQHNNYWRWESMIFLYFKSLNFFFCSKWPESWHVTQFLLKVHLRNNFIFLGITYLVCAWYPLIFCPTISPSTTALPKLIKHRDHSTKTPGSIKRRFYQWMLFKQSMSLLSPISCTCITPEKTKKMCTFFLTYSTKLNFW